MRRYQPLLGARVSQPLRGWRRTSFIKSIQRGTIALTNIGGGEHSVTATITAVDVNNSRLIYLGNITSGPAANQERGVYLRLTNATTVTATVGSGSSLQTVSYEVIEYYPGVIKSVQRGTIALNAVASNTATITSVNTSKSQMDFLGQDNTVGDDNRQTMARLALTNATTVTATLNTATALGITTVSYQVTEYY